MRNEIYDTLRKEVVKRMEGLPDIFQCGEFEIWINRTAFESAVSDELAATWAGPGIPPKTWIDAHYRDAMFEVCQAEWAPAGY